ncbi:MAG: hypothetical protein Harvfovirus12_13 [Harvfovirus sp.]|uniref:Uncharacterized protein n=1 Tax=Harvfovirus sp. TaxID=2487768 RepID=A0A3G5A186_9VIRU|nr:MAG: hypothetical protein Harvfovirus12_13 [Harvfovirus sp.]
MINDKGHILSNIRITVYFNFIRKIDFGFVLDVHCVLDI